MQHSCDFNERSETNKDVTSHNLALLLYLAVYCLTSINCYIMYSLHIKNVLCQEDWGYPMIISEKHTKKNKKNMTQLHIIEILPRPGHVVAALIVAAKSFLPNTITF